MYFSRSAVTNLFNLPKTPSVQPAHTELKQMLRQFFNNRLSPRLTASALGWCFLFTLGTIEPLFSLRLDHSCPLKWQEDYTRLHQSILDGTAAPQDCRYAVSISSPAGLADRLAGTVTVFYYALLTGRAFIDHTAIPGQIPFEAAFTAPNIDWIASEDYCRMLPSWKPGDLGLPSVKGDNFQHFNLLNAESDKERNETFEMFSSGNLFDLGKDIETVFITVNRGASVRLFNNPYHKHQLRRMGLAPETAFGCALQFLFSPVPAIMNMVKASVHLLAGAPSIGIHIRVGDNALHGSDTEQVDDYANFFECAEQVELALFPWAQKVIWLVLSDSRNLRRHATEAYGDKVQTLFVDRVEHSFGGSGDEAPFASLEGFWVAVAEHWVMGLTDVQIVDKKSGFGSTAAMRTFEFDRVFMIGHGEDVQCQRGHGTSVMNIGTFRAGAK